MTTISFEPKVDQRRLAAVEAWIRDPETDKSVPTPEDWDYYIRLAFKWDFVYEEILKRLDKGLLNS